MDVFEGDRSRYRHWLFDLNVAVGTIDKDLAKEVDRLVKTENILGDKWDYELDKDFTRELWDTYSGELYGVLVSITGGEAKSLVRGVVDLGFKQDGFKALVMLNERFGSRNSATLLQAFLEVVNPPQIKKIQDIVAMVHKWESRVAALKRRYQEDINDQIRLAILMGMLPQEYQDMIMQTSV